MGDGLLEQGQSTNPPAERVIGDSAPVDSQASGHAPTPSIIKTNIVRFFFRHSLSPRFAQQGTLILFPCQAGPSKLAPMTISPQPGVAQSMNRTIGE